MFDLLRYLLLRYKLFAVDPLNEFFSVDFNIVNQ